jgi:hypothetical protein
MKSSDTNSDITSDITSTNLWINGNADNITVSFGFTATIGAKGGSTSDLPALRLPN